MIKLVCVWRSGGDFALEHVERLTVAMRDNAPPGAQIVCVTDARPGELRHAQVDHLEPLEHGWPGWWSKFEMFKVQGPALYLDLDTVITGDLAPLCDTVCDYPVDLIMLRDFNRDMIASGVMGWRGDLRRLYHKFKAHAEQGTFQDRGGVPWLVPKMQSRRKVRGDQEWMREHLAEADVSTVYWQALQGGILSYKCHELAKKPHLPKDTRLVCFHGKPRPQHAPLTPWLREHYYDPASRLSPVTRRELMSAFSKGILTDYPRKHAGVLLVAGSAPCLAQDLDLAMKLRPGASVAALGHAAGMVQAEFLVSDHYETHVKMKSLQRELGNLEFTTHCAAPTGRGQVGYGVDHYWKFRRSACSSVETAIRMGLAVGFDEVILCGCPLEAAPMVHPDQVRKDGDHWPPPRMRRGKPGTARCDSSDAVLAGFQVAFKRTATNWDGRVKSMSGFTRTVVGAPDEDAPVHDEGRTLYVEADLEAGIMRDKDRAKAVQFWSGRNGMLGAYPKRHGTWPDPDAKGHLRQLCRGMTCEIGCGTGRCAEAFDPEDYVGVDINAVSLRAARVQHPGYTFSSIEYGGAPPAADTYLFYTVLLHVPDSCLREVLEPVLIVNPNARMVIFETMDGQYRNEEYGAYNRDVGVYDKLLADLGGRVRTILTLPSSVHPGIRHFMVADFGQAAQDEPAEGQS